MTPLNLGAATDDLQFEVAMKTCSSDLSMDLASLATLATDTGAKVGARSWDGPQGEHHVMGKLDFPSDYNGRPLLEGACTLTLPIVDVDAASRTFEWELR